MRFNRLVPELSVSDIQKSLDFYKKLGFKTEYARKEDKFAFLSFQGSQIMIQELGKWNDKKSVWHTGKLGYPFGRGMHFQMEVKNVNALFDRIKGKFPIKASLVDRWFRQNNSLLGMRYFLIMDPDGYLILFHQDIGKKKV
jgi:catechol 2,3-dioxygenase-like lactoylglutathione lyase family enzyme